MFYLTKRQDENQCTLGERVMVLVDSAASSAGAKGRIAEIYDGGITIQWDKAPDLHRGMDCFSRGELEYLHFGTREHPRLNPEVVRDLSGLETSSV